jgi:hypothetical protein
MYMPGSKGLFGKYHSDGYVTRISPKTHEDPGPCK